MIEVLNEQCKKPSRSATIEDTEYIKKTSREMIALCNKPLGKFKYALAIAHCQVNHEDPIRFFVTQNGRIIVNPKITESSIPYEHLEGCYSYPFRSMKKVRRDNYIRVQYYEIHGGKLAEKSQELHGLPAAIFQHEIDHFNGKSIYG